MENTTRIVVDLTKVEDPVTLLRGSSVKEIVLYSDGLSAPLTHRTIKSAINAVITSMGRVVIAFDPADLKLEHA